jgi:hypothetical protein
MCLSAANQDIVGRFLCVDAVGVGLPGAQLGLEGGLENRAVPKRSGRLPYPPVKCLVSVGALYSTEVE